VLLEERISVGQLDEYPVQYSAGSQAPAEALQEVVEGRYCCTQLPAWHLPVEQGPAEEHSASVMHSGHVERGITISQTPDTAEEHEVPEPPGQ
jgi:hypothetical protein